MSDKDGAFMGDSIYSQMSIEKLEEMLRFAAFSEDELDMEHVDRIMAELKRRDPKPQGLSPEEALLVFRNEYSGKESAYLDCAYKPREQARSFSSPQKPRRRRLFSRTVFAAAAIVVFILASMIVAQAAGIDVFGAIARWTDETFTLTREDNEPPPENSLHVETSAADYQTIEEALKAYGIEKRITPTWIPDGFELSEIIVSESLLGVSIYASFASEASILAISVDITDSPGAVYEKTDAEVQILSLGGVDYYLMENTNNNRAVWYADSCECSISGDISEDILIKMIESIYE